MTALIVVAVAGLLVVWHAYFLSRNRRQARQALSWFERVVAGHGRIDAVRWTGPSRFEASVEVSSVLFRQAAVRVRLHPRHSPFSWLWSRWRRQHETLQFEADLHCSPGFTLEVHNHRWCGWTRHSRIEESASEFQHVGPFVLTTRTDWQREITSMFTALVASRDCDFLSVRFSRSSPHFVVKVPLQALSPESRTASEFFTVLRELASCGSASRF